MISEKADSRWAFSTKTVYICVCTCTPKVCFPLLVFGSPPCQKRRGEGCGARGDPDPIDLPLEVTLSITIQLL